LTHHAFLIFVSSRRKLFTEQSIKHVIGLPMIVSDSENPQEFIFYCRQGTQPLNLMSIITGLPDL
jgi:hypothetical protein